MLGGLPIQSWGLVSTILGVKIGALCNEVGCAMMLGPVVSSVGGNGAPEKNGIGVGPRGIVASGISCPWLWCVVVDSKGCGVVGLHGSLGLFVAHFCKCYSLWNCFSCIDVECTQFCLCCGGHNCLDELCEVENSSIVGWVVAVRQ